MALNCSLHYEKAYSHRQNQKLEHVQLVNVTIYSHDKMYYPVTIKNEK